MLDFILSKMTWLIASILVMSFVIGFYQIQNDSIDDNLLQNTGEEINRVIKKLDAMQGESAVNFTFDGYNSYRAIYLPGNIGGDVYKLTFYSDYLRIETKKTVISLRFGTGVQPLQLGQETNVDLNDLLANSTGTYINRLIVYSNQDFTVASKSLDGIYYQLFVFLSTDTIYFSEDDEEGLRLLYGDSEPPRILNLTVEPDEKDVPSYVNITADIKGDRLNYVKYEVEHEDGNKQTVTMIEDTSVVAVDKRYYYNQTYTVIGAYSFEILAWDVFGRVDNDGDAFEVLDRVPPELSGLTPPPDSTCSSVIHFSFLASDNYALGEVRIDIAKPDGENHTTVIPGPSGDLWTYDFVPPHAPGYYSFTISANDTSGNTAESLTGSFTLIDITPPVILTVAASPNPGASNESITFSATVIDNYGVENVRLIIGSDIYIMVWSGGNIWTYSRSFANWDGTNIQISYSIRAVDASPSHNERTSRTRILTITSD